MSEQRADAQNLTLEPIQKDPRMRALSPPVPAAGAPSLPPAGQGVLASAGLLATTAPDVVGLPVAEGILAQLPRANEAAIACNAAHELGDLSRRRQPPQYFAGEALSCHAARRWMREGQ